jgi:hypothetical protein
MNVSITVRFHPGHIGAQTSGSPSDHHRHRLYDTAVTHRTCCGTTTIRSGSTPLR